MSRQVKVVTPRVFEDSRGWFYETHSPRLMAEARIEAEFIQDNLSLSRSPGTVRGFHFQTPPVAQAKLVRCTRGSIIDYVLDIRAGSPTFGRHVAVPISASDRRQVFVPEGFAHAFITLEADTEVAYKVAGPYSPEHEGGILWSDPALGLAWPLPGGTEPVLSEKDAALPGLAGLETPFVYDGDPLELRPEALIYPRNL